MQKGDLAAKSKQSPDPRARLSPFPSPVSCPVVSDDVQFNDTSVFIPESCVSDNPIRHERPLMTTNTTTVPLGMIPIPLR